MNLKDYARIAARTSHEFQQDKPEAENDHNEVINTKHFPDIGASSLSPKDKKTKFKFTKTLFAIFSILAALIALASYAIHRRLVQENEYRELIDRVQLQESLNARMEQQQDLTKYWKEAISRAKALGEGYQTLGNLEKQLAAASHRTPDKLEAYQQAAMFYSKAPDSKLKQIKTLEEILHLAIDDSTSQFYYRHPHREQDKEFTTDAYEVAEGEFRQGHFAKSIDILHSEMRHIHLMRSDVDKLVAKLLDKTPAKSVQSCLLMGTQLKRLFYFSWMSEIDSLPQELMPNYVLDRAILHAGYSLNSDSYLRIGTFMLQLGEYEAAQVALLRGIAIDPSNLRLKAKLRIASYQVGDQIPYEYSDLAIKCCSSLRKLFRSIHGDDRLAFICDWRASKAYSGVGDFVHAIDRGKAAIEEFETVSHESYESIRDIESFKREMQASLIESLVANGEIEDAKTYLHALRASDTRRPEHDFCGERLQKLLAQCNQSEIADSSSADSKQGRN